jgi:hypothetical protein
VSGVWNDNFLVVVCSRSLAVGLGYELGRSVFGIGGGSRGTVVFGVGDPWKVGGRTTHRLGVFGSMFCIPGDHDDPLADSYLAARMEMTAL